MIDLFISILAAWMFLECLRGPFNQSQSEHETHWQQSIQPVATLHPDSTETCWTSQSRGCWTQIGQAIKQIAAWNKLNGSRCMPLKTNSPNPSADNQRHRPRDWRPNWFRRDTRFQSRGNCRHTNQNAMPTIPPNKRPSWNPESSRQRTWINPWYNTRRWQKLSKQIRFRDWPECKIPQLCAHCLLKGKHTIAASTDHIINVASGATMIEKEKLMWDRNNLQPLCKPCHDAKSASEKFTSVKNENDQ